MTANQTEELPIGNLPPEGFMVGANSTGERVRIVVWDKSLTKDQALNLAAWLVALADPVGERFQRFLDAVRSS